MNKIVESRPPVQQRQFNIYIALPIIIVTGFVLWMLYQFICWLTSHMGQIWAEHGVLIVAIGSVTALGIFARPLWNAFKTLSNHKQEILDRQVDREFKRATTQVLTQGFNTEIVSGRTGDAIKVSNPYVVAPSKAAPLALPAPESEKEAIPAVVKYREIAEQIPPQLALLGIHPSNGNLEIVSADQLKTVWFVGGSNTGKTNTVFGKVGDCVRWGCKISICDQHAHKRDSLANKLGPYERAFLQKPAMEDDAIKDAILAFLSEFQRRRKGGKYTEKQLIVVDEVNGLCEHVVRVTSEEAEMIYERYGVEIKKERVKMRVFIQLLVETCGYESRGFDMFGFFISQKAADLYWLRKAAMTVIVHGLLMKSEALLACNDNVEAALLVMKFKKGRTYIFGYEIERPLELHQPLYEQPLYEHPTAYPEMPAAQGYNQPTMDTRMEDLPMRSEVPTSNSREVPTSEADMQADGRIVQFKPLLKHREAVVDTENLHAQNSEEDERVSRVARMMAEGKSVNEMLKLEWGIEKPGGAYQSALVGLREIQKVIARRMIG